MTRRAKLALGLLALLAAAAAAVLAWWRARPRTASVDVGDPVVTRDGVYIGDDYSTPAGLPTVEEMNARARAAIDADSATHPEIGDFLRRY